MALHAAADGTTFVSVINAGFVGSDAEKVKTALDATEGFAFVLAGAKAWLEHEVELNLVRDRFPKGLRRMPPPPGELAPDVPAATRRRSPR